MEMHSEGETLQVWDLPRDVLDAPVGSVTPRLSAYRDRIRRDWPVDPYELLERQRELFARYGFDDDLPLYDRILTGQMGTIEPANCLVELLFEQHLDRFSRPTSATRSPSEFVASVLVKASTVRVLFFSNDRPSVALPHLLRQKQQEALRDGWGLLAHLHNHSVWPENSSGDIAGTLIPSGPDRQLYLGQRDSEGLQEAWITNGFDQIRIPAAQFGQFPEARRSRLRETGLKSELNY